MMKKIILVLLISALFPLLLPAQCEDQVVFDEDAGDEILIGSIDWSCFDNDLFFDWFMSEYEAYIPAPGVIKELNGIQGNIRLVIYLGTWCPDSRREVPRFKKILDELSLEVEVEIIALNRQKHLSDGSSPGEGIEFVPTFIIYRDDLEAGRIVETPEVSLEEDLLKILAE